MSDTAVARTIVFRVQIDILEHKNREDIYAAQRLLEQVTGESLGDPELDAVREGIQELLNESTKNLNASVTVLDGGVQ